MFMKFFVCNILRPLSMEPRAYLNDELRFDCLFQALLESLWRSLSDSSTSIRCSSIRSSSAYLLEPPNLKGSIMCWLSSTALLTLSRPPASYCFPCCITSTLMALVRAIGSRNGDGILGIANWSWKAASRPTPPAGVFRAYVNELICLPSCGPLLKSKGSEKLFSGCDKSFYLLSSNKLLS